MTSITLPHRRPLPSREIVIAAIAIGLTALIGAAATRAVLTGGFNRIAIHQLWLAIHLATVIPALPLGAYLLLRPKGDRLHKMLGRLWALMMVTTALVSFGVQSQGHLSWIHLFSVLVLVSVPRAVWLAMRGDITAHRNAMLRVYMGLIGAGLFTFVPGRILGQWLFG